MVRTVKVLSQVALTLLVAAVLVSPARAQEEKPRPKTLENLMAAYNGESNAHAKYLEYAKKADEEGYGKVASLFRAAARAEDIHAGNHAKVIEEMGGTPKAEVKLPEIKSTADNLKAAIEGESYERDTMYPDFIKVAREEKNKSALRSFNYAKTAEAEHAKLYKEALDNLDQWKGQKMDWYVCTVCGWTTAKLPAEKCPSCFNPVDKYVKVD